MSESFKTSTINLLTTNQPGVLVRVSLVFARRGYNIDSLVVSHALDGRFARMAITAKGDPNTLDQIIKQVSKLVDIVEASVFSQKDSICRELALFKVKLTLLDRTPLLELVAHFKGKTVDFTEDFVIIQLTGETDMIDSFQKMLMKYKVVEVVRTGKILMLRDI